MQMVDFNRNGPFFYYWARIFRLIILFSAFISRAFLTGISLIFGAFDFAAGGGWLMKTVMLAFLFMVSVTVPFGCGKNPEAPGNPTPTPTPPPIATPSVIPDNNGPLIQALIGRNVGPMFQGSGAYVVISDNYGNPVDSANVTLVHNGSSIPLPFFGEFLPTSYWSTAALIAFSSIGFTPANGGVYYDNTNVTYTAGQSYVFNINILGSSYSSTITSINGSPDVTDGSSAVTCSRDTAVGNANFILVWDSNYNGVTLIGPPIPSNPYVIPSSSFAGWSWASSPFVVTLAVNQLNKPSFTGCKNSSCTAAIDAKSVTCF
jgi:hypothetical protein